MLLVEVMNSKSSCMKFPCFFPVKVMGLNSDSFESAVREILTKHVKEARITYASKLSSNGKYLSITATFMATSREQLDALYQELNDHELVVMTL